MEDVHSRRGLAVLELARLRFDSRGAEPHGVFRTDKSTTLGSLPPCSNLLECGLQRLFAEPRCVFGEQQQDHLIVPHSGTFCGFRFLRRFGQRLHSSVHRPGNKLSAEPVAFFA